MSLNLQVLLMDHKSYCTVKRYIYSVGDTCIVTWTMIAATPLPTPTEFTRCQVVHDSLGNAPIVIDYLPSLSPH